MQANVPLALTVRDLGVRYGDKVVLRGLSFAVGRGEVYGLLGPNGAGKSTALQVLCGLVGAQEGEILLDGRPVRPGGRELRRCLGVVFQSPSLDGRLTARENLLLGAALHGIPRSDAVERAAHLLVWAGLDGRQDEPVAQYSGGMRRRLELARALLPKPELLVLDEPTSGLDEMAFRATWERILSLREEEGVTVLLTTHRPEEAERCDRLAILDGGRLVAEGTPEELKRNVAGDLITLEADDPGSLVEELNGKLSLGARLVDGTVVVERERGHELVPRLVEALSPGRLRSVGLRRPGLAEAFLKLTGHALAWSEARGMEKPKHRGRKAAA